MAETDGVLIVDKPQGPTSHAVVDWVRHRFGVRKVGHGGTLDPIATGLLVVLLGRATKRQNEFFGQQKAYDGVMALGITTTSGDADGDILDIRDVGAYDEEMIRSTFRIAAEATFTILAYSSIEK